MFREDEVRLPLVHHHLPKLAGTDCIDHGTLNEVVRYRTAPPIEYQTAPLLEDLLASVADGTPG